MKYSEIAEVTGNQYLRRVYEIIAQDAGKDDSVAHSVNDSISVPSIVHSLDSINEIRENLYQYQQSLSAGNDASITVEEFQNRVLRQAYNFVVTKYRANQSLGVNDDGTKNVDSWYNSVTGIGTTSDPGMYNTADIPISINPQQATAYYASGGIPRVIIDKKVNGPFINGYYFEGDFTKKELDAFKEHYNRLGLTKAMKSGLRDALIFGGAGIIPHFTFDNNKLNYAKSLSMMGSMGEKKIDRFWTADRWNLVLIPNTDIEAEDYFYPPYFYCPIAGVEINTDRMAIIRINELPFWGAIAQIGWGVSDMESWMKSVLSYNIMISSIPVMGQQISLVYQHIPADPIIFANGPQVFEQWAEANNQQLTLWNVSNPKTFNSYGEIKTLERTYAGYGELIQLLRDNIGAESTIPESSIFHTQSKGFSDNLEDVTLKQSEAFKQISNIFCEQMAPLVRTMGYDFFGKGKEDKINTLKLCLDSNTIITNDQKSSLGMNFFNMLQVGTSAGLPADLVGKIAGKFISGVQIDDDIIKLLAKGQEIADGKEEEDRKAQADQAKKSGLFGMGGSGGGAKGLAKPGSIKPAMKSSLTPGSKNDQKKMSRVTSGKGKK